MKTRRKKTMARKRTRSTAGFTSLGSILAKDGTLVEFEAVAVKETHTLQIAEAMTKRVARRFRLTSV